MLVKILSYNIRFGGRGREAELAEVIRAAAPDLVVFQEAIYPDVIERLAVATSLPIWAARRKHSIGYLSRLAVAHHEWHYPAGAKHSFLEIALEGTDARIFGLHLSASFSKWSERQRAREIQALLKGIERYQQGIHVLVGDFNTLAPGEILDVRRMPGWIRALIWVSGRELQRETITIMAKARYADGYRLLHPDVKGYTFPTWDPHLRLDYVFLPERFSEQLRSCEVVDQPPKAKQASDHFPLLAQLELGDS
jgi:endonuclease/exonuclease/phosphatase family metal-dependent hydrolase